MENADIYEWPNRHFIQYKYNFDFSDSEGFLSAENASIFIKPENLFQHWACLILAAPWTGKTHVAKKLIKRLQTTPDFKHQHLTCFETQTSPEVFPEWWAEWSKSENDKACWIIDALDEGQHRIAGIHEKIYDKIESLNGAQRGRLKLIVFSRPSSFIGIWSRKLQGLKVVKHNAEDRGFITVGFAPLTRDEAQHIVGGEQQFKKVVNLIQKYNLKPLAAFPSALQHLTHYDLQQKLDAGQVWRKVLHDLLLEQNTCRSDSGEKEKIEPEEQFRAAAHLAAALTFLGREEITTDGDHTINDLINEPLNEPLKLRKPARKVLESAIFRQTSDGYCFSQKNIQERLCAFSLAEVSLKTLKSLVCDSRGNVFSVYADMVDFLKTISSDPEVQSWDAKAEIPLAEIKKVFNILKKKITEVVVSPMDFSRLKNDKLGRELQRHLKNYKTVNAGFVNILLEIASQTQSKEAVTGAIEIALDDNVDNVARKLACGLILEHGTEDEVRRLEKLAKSRKKNAQFCELKAYIIEGLLNRSVWDISAASHFAPQKSPDQVDSTVLLHARIKQEFIKDKKATVELIRKLLGAKNGKILNVSRLEHLNNVQKGILVSALEVIVRQEEDLTDAQIDVLPWLLFHDLSNLTESARYKLINPLIAKLSTRESFRREIYESSLQAPNHESLFRLLQVDDSKWLIELISNLKSVPDFAWRDLFILYRKVTDSVLKSEVEKLFNDKVPEKYAEFLENDMRLEAQYRQIEEEEAQGKKQRYSISEIVRDWLEMKIDSDDSLGVRFTQLSWICFTEKNSRPNNVDGNWEDLPEELKKRVLDLVEQGLKECTRTIIPDGSTFSLRTIQEAAAFKAFLFRGNKVNERLVSEWLPAVLRSGGENVSIIIEQCFLSEREATSKVAIDWLDRELREDNSALVISNYFPAKMWTEHFADEVQKRFEDATIKDKSKASLLRLLSARRWEKALDYAKTLVSSDKSVLQIAALNALLTIDPVVGWKAVKEEYLKNSEILKQLDGLRTFVDSRLSQLPPDLLAELGNILYEKIPVKNAGEEMGGLVTAEDELKWLRDSIPHILWKRGAEKELDSIAQRVPSVRRWVKQIKTQKEVRDVFEALYENPFLELSVILKVLSEKDFHLLRSNDDLLSVVVETLESIGKRASLHVEMLHHKEKGSRTHLPESALQAYILCRLQDLLPGKLFIREPEIEYLQKLDILVVASDLERRPLTVVIEIKWSDNSKVLKNLKSQLGERYLVADNRTHGVYLVGWAGKGRNRIRQRQTLFKHLSDQASRYCLAKPSVKIKCLVLDLSWHKIKKS